MRWARKDSPVPRSFAARSRVLSRLATIVLSEMEEHCENYGLKPRSNNQPGVVSRKSEYFFGPEQEYSNQNLKNKSVSPGEQVKPFCFVN